MYRYLIVLVIGLTMSSCSQAGSLPATEIPVMEGAVSGKWSEGGYSYLVDAPLAEVEAFYIESLTPDGWEYIGLGEGLGGIFLSFTRELQYLAISARKSELEAYTRINIQLQDISDAYP